MKRIFCYLLSISLLVTLTGCQLFQKKTPPEVPQPEESRQALIQSSWQEKGPYRGFPEGMTFCNLENRVDGIRYYGSYEYKNYKDEMVTCDILYIPCETLDVPSQYTSYDGYNFISHSAFGLYTYERVYYSSWDEWSDYFNPFPYSPSIPSDVRDAVLSNAVAIHNAYEEWLYGSVLTKLPNVDADKEYARVQAAWLLQSGIVCDFEDAYAKDYWGNFDGWDIFLQQGVGLAETTYNIAGHKFTFGSACTIYAYKDGSFYLLQHAYAQGLIDAETIGRIADPSNHWKPASCDDSNGKTPNHKYKKYIAKYATCEADGTMQYSCQKCYSRYSEVIPALGHNYVDYICQTCGKVNPPSEHGLTLGVWYTISEDQSLLVLTFYEDGTFTADFYSKTLDYDEYRKNSKNLVLVEMDTLKVAYRRNADRYSEKGTYTIDGDILTLTCPYYNHWYECMMDASFQLTMTDCNHMIVKYCSTSMINPIYEFEIGDAFIWTYRFKIHN